MNRKSFLKTAALAAIALAVRTPRPRIGYIAIGTAMPAGTTPGDWVVIDEETGKTPVPSGNFPPDTKFYIQAANDEEGWCVGTSSIRYKAIDGQNMTHGFRIHTPIRIKYVGKRPEYQKYA